MPPGQLPRCRPLDAPFRPAPIYSPLKFRHEPTGDRTPARIFLPENPRRTRPPPGNCSDLRAGPLANTRRFGIHGKGTPRSSIGNLQCDLASSTCLRGKSPQDAGGENPCEETERPGSDIDGERCRRKKNRCRNRRRQASGIKGSKLVSNVMKTFPSTVSEPSPMLCLRRPG